MEELVRLQTLLTLTLTLMLPTEMPRKVTQMRLMTLLALPQIFRIWKERKKLEIMRASCPRFLTMI